MRISLVEKETTMTTDKNNFCHPGATAPGFKSAARLRGEKEEVVFTSCFCCFLFNDTYPHLHSRAKRGRRTTRPKYTDYWWNRNPIDRNGVFI